MAAKRLKVARLQSRNATARRTTNAPRKIIRQPVPFPSLDQAAAQYAKLLSDPCNGPLVNGPFADGRGSIVQRFETDVLINTSATDTGSYFALVPSLNTYYIGSAAVTGDLVPITPAGLSITSYLANNASSARALSACLQVFWAGSEQNRSGILGLGCMPAFTAAPTATTVVTGTLRQASQLVTRVPDQMIEIKWCPAENDYEWFAPGSAAIPGARDNLTALVMSLAGIPVSTGIRVRAVVVYEYQPKAGIGSVTPALAASSSRNSIRDVLNYLSQNRAWFLQQTSNLATTIAPEFGMIKAAGKSIMRMMS
jgi:hypothetical protein